MPVGGRAEELFFEGLAGELAFHDCLSLSVLTGAVGVCTRLVFTGSLGHLRILLPCVRAFLNEFLQQVERGQIPARHWLGAANQVLKLTTNHRARKIASEHQINWLEILPLSAIAKSQHEKIRRFQEQQLE